MGGTTLEMMSFLGADREGPFRYDGCVDATSTGAKVAGHERHGRGLCQWKMTFAEKEDEREKSRTIMRHAYYDGFWDRSAKNGQAMVKFADDSVFEGAYKKPTGLQGYGRMAYSNGSWYEGSWHHGLKHGYGSPSLSSFLSVSLALFLSLLASWSQARLRVSLSLPFSFSPPLSFFLS